MDSYECKWLHGWIWAFGFHFRIWQTCLAWKLGWLLLHLLECSWIFMNFFFAVEWFPRPLTQAKESQGIPLTPIFVCFFLQYFLALHLPREIWKSPSIFRICSQLFHFLTAEKKRSRILSELSLSKFIIALIVRKREVFLQGLSPQQLKKKGL